MIPHRKLTSAGAVLLLLALLPRLPATVADEPKPDSTATKSAPVPRWARPGSLPVGVRTVILTDESRDDPHTKSKRQLVVEIWYPSTDGAPDFPKTTFGEFFGAYRDEAERVLRQKLEGIERRFETVARRGAPIAPAPKASESGKGGFPFLVFSHGNGGFRHQNVFQADHLASHGYIVASADHTGNARLAPLPGGAVFYDRKGRQRSAEQRPADVRFLIDWFTARNQDASSWLRGRVDLTRIGVYGHSFGGFTACRAAVDDDRIGAIVPMTVALAGLGVAPAEVPTLVMLAKHDRTVRSAGNLASKAYFLACPAEKILLDLRRAGHFTFCDMAILDPNYGDGIGRGKGLGNRIMDFIPVPLAKEIINAYTLAFFEAHLGGDEKAHSFVSSNRYPDEIDFRFQAPRVVGKPPARLALPKFYRKYVDAGGLPVVASGKVRDHALLEARYLIERVLSARPAVLQAMAANRVRFAVMAHDEFTTSIPEHGDLKPAPYWDKRARGLGATFTRPAVSCGEENLLGFPGDPYPAENTLIRELAHAIHITGLSSVDPDFDRKLQETYRRALDKGLWKGTFAATHHREYWAEGVQSWFDCNRPPDPDHNDVDTREELREYDPDLARLIEATLGENAWRYTPTKERLNEGHLEGYDPSSAPTFVWPRELVEWYEKYGSEQDGKERAKRAGESNAPGRPPGSDKRR